MDEEEVPCQKADVGSDKTLITYKCQFYVDPVVHPYYYNPSANELDSSSEPILIGSPIFDGPANTKWQVTTTFNRWIGCHRWLPLYLTRIDDVNLDSVRVQCEFSIVDKDGNILNAQRGKLSPSIKHFTQGFTKFFPFCNIKDVLQDNCWLMINMHLKILIPSHSEEPQKEKLPSTETNSENKGEGMPCYLDICLAPSFGEDDIEESDKMGVMSGGEWIGWVSRKKLIENSLYFSEIQAAVPDDPMTEFELKSSFSKFSTSTIEAFLTYVNKGKCEVLESENYEQQFDLYQLAEALTATKLMEECLRSMTLYANVHNAHSHAQFLCATVGQSDELEIEDDVLEHFRSYFRQNIIEIQEEETFLELYFYHDQDYYTSFILDPDFSFN